MFSYFQIVTSIYKRHSILKWRFLIIITTIAKHLTKYRYLKVNSRLGTVIAKFVSHTKYKSQVEKIEISLNQRVG